MAGLFIIIIPNLAFASWWNPFTWFNFWGKEATPIVQQVKIATTTTTTASITNKTVPLQSQKIVNVQDYKQYELISNGAPVISNTSDEERNNYSRHFSFSVKIKNVKVLPFITGVRVGDCRGPNAAGGIREYYSWGGIIFKSYSKALLPGEEDTIDFTYNLETSGSICSYSSNGIRICEDPYKDVSKITSCDFTISTDASPIGSNNGKFKQTLEF